jgi:kumamolisin
MVTIVLRPPEALQKKIDKLGKGSPAPLSYEKYLELYGTPDKELQQVEKWASSAQLQFVEGDWREKAKLSGAVHLVGTQQQLSAIFGVESQGATGALQLKMPKALGEVALWVFGVHNPDEDAPPELRSTPSPLKELERRATSRRLFHREPEKKKLSSKRSLSAQRPGLSPLEVAQAYRYPDNHGAGQCLGLIELSGTYSPDDVHTYLTGLGISPLPTIVDVNCRPNPVPSPMSDMEVTMDLELAAAVCPGAKLVVYNACSQDYSLQDFFEVFNTAIFDTENRPSVLSASWGFPEFVPGLGLKKPTKYSITKEEEQPFNLLFAKAALLGITLCVSSGDTGSLTPFPCNNSPWLSTLMPITNFPAASPYVLSCGGTQQVSAQAPLTEQMVWNELDQVLIIGDGPYAFPAVGGSSGGGISFLNDAVAYQEDCPVPRAVVAAWVNGVYTLVKQNPGRGVPDVAALANPSPGYSIFLKGQYGTGGGTSAAAPMWAALITRVNAALGRRVGFLNPSLYQLQAEHSTLCTTITRGGSGAYNASDAIWNPCAGLGTPNGVGIVNALKKA